MSPCVQQQRTADGTARKTHSTTSSSSSRGAHLWADALEHLLWEETEQLPALVQRLKHAAVLVRACSTAQYARARERDRERQRDRESERKRESPGSGKQ